MTDSEQNSKVLKISKRKNAKKDTSDDKPKLTPGQLEDFLFRYLDEGNKNALPYGSDPDMVHGKYDVYLYWEVSTKDPRLVLLNDETGIAEEIGFKKLDQILYDCLKRFNNSEYASSIYCLSANQRKSLAMTISSSGRTTDKWPMPIGFKSSSGFYFKRHNFDPAKKATPRDFPTISLNLRHMTNARNFCERVGSLYDPNANRKQIIFMVGDGDGGKSALLNLLTALAGGPDGVAPVSMSVFDTFGLDPLLDKRVWVGEELSPNFFKNDKYKILTGGTAVQINRKRERQFNAHLTGMLFCASNNLPELKDDSGLRNRLIICEVEPVPEKERLNPFETEKRMIAELPYFIRYCMDAYQKVGGDGTLIPDSTTCLESIIEENDTEVSVIFDEYFEVDLTALGKHAKVTPADYQTVWERICWKNPAFAKSNSRKSFDEYVKKQLGRKSLRMKCRAGGGRPINMIPGIRIK